MQHMDRALLHSLADAFGLNGAAHEHGVSLDGVQMKVKQTGASGEIGEGTRFTFRQDGSLVLGRYAGGAIEDGMLVGSIDGSSLIFIYGQRNASHRIDMGVSHCQIRTTRAGLEITEEFQWLTRSASGTNTLVQCGDSL